MHFSDSNAREEPSSRGGGVLGSEAQTWCWSAKLLKVLSLARLCIPSTAHKTVCLHHWFLLKGYGPSSWSTAASRQANMRTSKILSALPCAFESRQGRLFWLSRFSFDAICCQLWGDWKQHDTSDHPAHQWWVNRKSAVYLGDKGHKCSEIKLHFLK